MNILPKKRWHVRTKENIARVRKDEAEAAEKEKLEQARIAAADREARLSVLKYKSRQRLAETGIVTDVPDVVTESPGTTHINLFKDFEKALTTTNKQHEQEITEKKEEYEKKIGYLTYLGQDTNESLGKKNWYEVAPSGSGFSRGSDIRDTYDKLVLKDVDGKPKIKETDEKDGEISWKQKQRLDPLNAFKKYCFNGKEKHPKSHPHQEKTDCIKNRKVYLDSKDKLQKMREVRLKREKLEKIKTEQFLSGHLTGTVTINESKEVPNKIKPKYNSQFNPELARQNYR